MSFLSINTVLVGYRPFRYACALRSLRSHLNSFLLIKLVGIVANLFLSGLIRLLPIMRSDNEHGAHV